MKYLLLFLFAVSVLISCSKDDNSAIVNTQTPVSLQNKTWLLDSLITTTPNYTNVDHPDANQKQTIVFSKDTLVTTTGAYRTTYNSFYDGNSIIYYWLPGSTDTRSMYWQIDSQTADSKLVLKQFPQSDKTIMYFYHVQ